MNRKKKKMSLSAKRSRTGFLFILPWLIGFIWFYARSLFMSIQFSLSNLSVSPGGGYTLDFVGLDNFLYAFRAHATYKQVLTTSVGNMLIDVPLITFFSLFMAILLNRKFRGRTLVRAIFFLPVILNSEAIVDAMDLARNMMSGGLSSASAEMAQASSGGMGIAYYMEMFGSLGIPEFLIVYLMGAVTRVSDIINASGVQIIISLRRCSRCPARCMRWQRLKARQHMRHSGRLPFRWSCRTLSQILCIPSWTALPSPMSWSLPTTRHLRRATMDSVPYSVYVRQRLRASYW